MFGVDTSEFLVVAVIALLFIGPKDLPRVMMQVGRWVGKARGYARHFTSGVENVIREAELDEMEKEWKAKNAEIMAAHPPGAAAEAALVGQDPGTGFSEPLAPDAPVKAAEPTLDSPKAG